MYTDADLEMIELERRGTEAANASDRAQDVPTTEDLQSLYDNVYHATFYGGSGHDAMIVWIEDAAAFDGKYFDPFDEGVQNITFGAAVDGHDGKYGYRRLS
jgi:hypothetical protein